MTMAVDYWMGKERTISDVSKEWVVEQFTGWAYYRMGRSDVRTKIDTLASKIETGQILTGSDAQPYIDVLRLLILLGKTGLTPSRRFSGA